MPKLLLQANLYVSYNQFMVHDASVTLPGLVWTTRHSQQGFARRLSTVSFRTLIPHGGSTIKVYLGSYSASTAFNRVIAVPFYSPTGRVLISAPEEDNGHFDIEPGHYELVAAQRVTRAGQDQASHHQLEIELHLCETDTQLLVSKILVADPDIQPPAPLIEDADVAEV